MPENGGVVLIVIYAEDLWAQNKAIIYAHDPNRARRFSK